MRGKLKKIGLTIVTLLVLAVAFVVLSFVPPKPLAATSARFSLSGVTLVEPGLNRQVGQTLSIADGRISAEKLDAEVFDFDQHYVLPGLINPHIHLPNQTPLHLTEYVGLLYLAYGVTSVRNAGDLSGDSTQAARVAFEQNGFAGPRINSCGPLVEGDATAPINVVALTEPAEAAAVVDQVQQAGGQCIKAHDNLDPARTTALAAAAEAAGLPLLGHISHGMTLETSDIPNVQHLLGIVQPDALAARHDLLYRRIDWRSVDAARIAAAVAVSVDKNLIHTPTLVSLENFSRFENLRASLDSPATQLMPRFIREVLWHPTEGLLYRDLGQTEFDLIRDALPKKIDMVGQLYQAGATLQLGSDDLQPFGVPGEALWREMKLFAQAEIPLEDIWAFATWRVAGEFGVDKLGRLQPGAPADLLVFAADPTADLANLDSLVAVVRDGKLYPRADIQAALHRYQDFYRRWLVDLVSVNATRFALQSASPEADAH